MKFKVPHKNKKGFNMSQLIKKLNHQVEVYKESLCYYQFIHDILGTDEDWRDSIDKTLDLLPDSQGEMVKYQYGIGCKYPAKIPEIAEIFDLHQGSVRKQLKEARKKLQTHSYKKRLLGNDITEDEIRDIDLIKEENRKLKDKLESLEKIIKR